jgi:hypothetical protein
MMVAGIRGWGHLTGKGAMGLPESEAVMIQVANSHLIAAAPDLLRELENARGVIHAIDNAGLDCDCHMNFDDEAIDAAIAKAKGETK